MNPHYIYRQYFISITHIYPHISHIFPSHISSIWQCLFHLPKTIFQSSAAGPLPHHRRRLRSVKCSKTAEKTMDWPGKMMNVRKEEIVWERFKPAKTGLVIIGFNTVICTVYYESTYSCVKHQNMGSIPENDGWTPPNPARSIIIFPWNCGQFGRFKLSYFFRTHPPVVFDKKTCSIPRLLMFRRKRDFFLRILTWIVSWEILDRPVVFVNLQHGKHWDLISLKRK